MPNKRGKIFYELASFYSPMHFFVCYYSMVRDSLLQSKKNVALKMAMRLCKNFEPTVNYVAFNAYID